MGYRELLQALEEEVGRQIRELRAAASEERGKLLDATRTEVAQARETAVEAERRRLRDQAARVLSAARLGQERALLTEARREMDVLQQEAEARLPAVDDGHLLGRLVDELVPELGDEAVEFRVAPGHEKLLRDHLRHHHPALAARATIVGRAGVGGGVEASLDGRQVLDNTLASRLRRAWQLHEPEIASILLGDGHGGM